MAIAIRAVLRPSAAFTSDVDVPSMPLVSGKCTGYAGDFSLRTRIKQSGDGKIQGDEVGGKRRGMTVSRVQGLSIERWTNLVEDGSDLERFS